MEPRLKNTGFFSCLTLVLFILRAVFVIAGMTKAIHFSALCPAVRRGHVGCLKSSISGIRHAHGFVSVCFYAFKMTKSKKTSFSKEDVS